LKAIKVVEKVLKAFLKARRITKLSRERHLLGRWRPWDNFFTEVTDQGLVVQNTISANPGLTFNLLF
jgi:hypothetical protein